MRPPFETILLVGALLSPQPAAASVLTPQSLSISADVRAIAVNGETSWLNEGFGKLRSGGAAGQGLRLKPELGSIDVAWQPRVGFTWSATIVGTLQGGERTEAGLSEAFISYKPMRGEKLRFSARAGLMWPPISLEHGGADWHVLDTITPSAINSWVGEEVRPLALEGTLGTRVGAHEVSATAGLMAANDTAGTLLALRGWALHDRKTLAFRRQPLPPLVDKLVCCQPQFTTPLMDIERGFAKRPGYYAKLAWQPPLPVWVEAFHFDNRADPETVNENLEWGWRTRFDNIGLAARIAPNTELKAQAMKGSARMGFNEAGRIWVDTRFSSAFLLLAHRSGKATSSARLEAFRTNNDGSVVADESDDQGSAVTAAYSRQLTENVSLGGELLHVRSKRRQREIVGLKPRQNQTQLQLVARARW